MQRRPHKARARATPSPHASKRGPPSAAPASVGRAAELLHRGALGQSLARLQRRVQDVHLARGEGKVGEDRSVKDLREGASNLGPGAEGGANALRVAKKRVGRKAGAGLAGLLGEARQSALLDVEAAPGRGSRQQQLPALRVADLRVRRNKKRMQAVRAISMLGIQSRILPAFQAALATRLWTLAHRPVSPRSQPAGLREPRLHLVKATPAWDIILFRRISNYK